MYIYDLFVIKCLLERYFLPIWHHINYCTAVPAEILHEACRMLHSSSVDDRT